MLDLCKMPHDCSLLFGHQFKDSGPHIIPRTGPVFLRSTLMLKHCHGHAGDGEGIHSGAQPQRSSAAAG